LTLFNRLSLCHHADAAVKTCSYCGQSNDDAIAVCSGCGTAFSSQSPIIVHPAISRRLGKPGSLLRSLHRFFRPGHPLDARNLGDKARDIAFRVMQEDDIPRCLSFYRANEAAHFPPGRLEHYAAQLRNRTFLTLLSTRAGKPVGCCGISYTIATDGFPIGSFCFGMVDPAHQRQGIGTAQVLVRLALLTSRDDLALAIMFAVSGSVSFYRRFGFKFDCELPADDGGVYPFGLFRASQTFLDDCRTELARRNITYPDVRDSIPRHKPSDSAAPQEKASAG
jgi:predicted N-acetyltransferase YhbS